MITDELIVLRKKIDKSRMIMGKLLHEAKKEKLHLILEKDSFNKLIDEEIGIPTDVANYLIGLHLIGYRFNIEEEIAEIGLDKFNIARPTINKMGDKEAEEMIIKVSNSSSKKLKGMLKGKKKETEESPRDITYREVVLRVADDFGVNSKTALVYLALFARGYDKEEFENKVQNEMIKIKKENKVLNS